MQQLAPRVLNVATFPRCVTLLFGAAVSQLSVRLPGDPEIAGGQSAVTIALARHDGPLQFAVKRAVPADGATTFAPSDSTFRVPVYFVPIAEPASIGTYALTVSSGDKSETVLFTLAAAPSVALEGLERLRFDLLDPLLALVTMPDPEAHGKTLKQEADNLHGSGLEPFQTVAVNRMLRNTRVVIGGPHLSRKSLLMNAIANGGRPLVPVGDGQASRTNYPIILQNTRPATEAESTHGDKIPETDTTPKHSAGIRNGPFRVVIAFVSTTWAINVLASARETWSFFELYAKCAGIQLDEGSAVCKHRILDAQHYRSTITAMISQELGLIHGAMPSSNDTRVNVEHDPTTDTVYAVVEGLATLQDVARILLNASKSSDSVFSQFVASLTVEGVFSDMPPHVTVTELPEFGGGDMFRVQQAQEIVRASDHAILCITDQIVDCTAVCSDKYFLQGMRTIFHCKGGAEVALFVSGNTLELDATDKETAGKNAMKKLMLAVRDINGKLSGDPVFIDTVPTRDSSGTVMFAADNPSIEALRVTIRRLSRERSREAGVLETGIRSAVPPVGPEAPGPVHGISELASAQKAEAIKWIATLVQGVAAYFSRKIQGTGSQAKKGVAKMDEWHELFLSRGHTTADSIADGDIWRGTYYFAFIHEVVRLLANPASGPSYGSSACKSIRLVKAKCADLVSEKTRDVLSELCLEWETQARSTGALAVFLAAKFREFCQAHYQNQDASQKDRIYEFFGLLFPAVSPSQEPPVRSVFVDWVFEFFAAGLRDLSLLLDRYLANLPVRIEQGSDTVSQGEDGAQKRKAASPETGAKRTK